MKKRLGSKTNLEIGSQDAPNFTRPVRQHEKSPPPITVPISASTTNLHSKPNYMKSTISTNTRREQANMRRHNHLDVTNSSKNVTKELAGIRTLMERDASFGPERTLVRKYPPDVLCRSLQVKRVTCSSTLKRFNSPERISNGGTESEGTSVVKVCSYSRCSLNAHVHALLPPLNSFPSARREMLKTDRSIKQTRGSRNAATLTGRDEASTLKGGEMCCDIDSRENLEENGNLNSAERVAAAHIHEIYNEVIAAGHKSPQYSAQEAKKEILKRRCGRSMPNVNLQELDPQSSDMDREKGKHYPTYLDDYECAPKMEEESGEQEGMVITSDKFIMKPDDRLGYFFDEISANEVSQESFDEERLNSDTQFNGDYCDSVGSYNYPESLCSRKPSALVSVPVPEATPVCKNDALFEGSQTPRTHTQNGKTAMGWDTTDGEEHNLKDESLPNEDPTTEKENQVPHPLEGHAEEMATSVDSAMCKDVEHDQDHVYNFNGGNQTPGLHPQNSDATMHLTAMDGEKHNRMRLTAMDGEKHNRKDGSLLYEDPATDMGNQAPHISESPAEETTAFIDRAPCKAIEYDQVSNQTSAGDTDCSSEKYHTINIENLQDHVENEHNSAENFNGESTNNLTNEPYTEFSRKNSSEAECKVVREVKSRNMETPETEDKSSIQATIKCKKSNQEADGLPCFNPHEPHILPLESDPEAEKVNLRHQELDARKNAEEWMVDYALREAVTKIGPACQRKVATLVEAFERVLPTSKS